MISIVCLPEVGDTIGVPTGNEGVYTKAKVINISYLGDTDTRSVPSGLEQVLSVLVETKDGVTMWFPLGEVDLSSVGHNTLPELDKISNGLEPRPDNSKMYDIVKALLLLQWYKEGTYGSSWKGKGEYRGIMANIDRKYDRLDKITSDEIDGLRDTLPTKDLTELTDEERKNIGESKIDAIADLANYCLLYMTYVRSRYPGAFQLWVLGNLPDHLRARVPSLLKG